MTMTSPTELPVTVFAGGATDTDRPELGTVAGAIRVIAGDTYRPQVTWIRACRRNADPTAEDAKRQLPVIVWSGSFRRRAAAGVERYTGVVVLDVDDLEDEAAADSAVQALREDPHVLACFRSPGGVGCKPVVLTDAADPTDHAAAWATARRYIESRHGLPVSGAQQDVSRACFASHDPHAWCNASAVPLAIDRMIVPPAAVAATEASPEAPRKIGAGQRHAYLIAYCARLARAGLGESEIEAAAQALIRDRFAPGREFPPREIRDAIQSGLAKFSRNADDAAAIVHGGEVAAALVAAYEAGLAGAPAGDQALAGLVLRSDADRRRDCLYPPPALIAGLLPVGGIGALIALPGQGKTLVALELARCLAAGEAFAGREVIGGPVVYLATDAPDDTERRMLALGAAAGQVWSVAEAPRFPAGLPELEAALDRVPGCRLVVLDTWDSTREHTAGGYSQEDGQIEETMAALRRLAKARQLSVVVIHHATRGDATRARGSAVFDARCDLIGLVSQEGPILTLCATKVRSGPGGEIGRWEVRAEALEGAPDAPPVPRLVEVGLLASAAAKGQEAVAKRDARMREVLAVIAAVPAGTVVTRAALMDALGLKSARAIAAVADELRDRGWMARGSFQITPEGVAAYDAEGK